jgi:hypothetical protein
MPDNGLGIIESNKKSKPTPHMKTLKSQVPFAALFFLAICGGNR